jgi:AraC-like DNA-binding protein
MAQNPASAGAYIQINQLRRFSPQDMDGVIDSVNAEHVQLGKGDFEGSLLRAKSSDKTFDSGIYSQSILGRTSMPADRVFVGMALPAQTGGLLEGHKLDHPTPYIYTECAELGCRLEPGTRWFGFQVGRKEIEAYGLHLPDNHSGMIECTPGSRRRLMNEFSTILQEFTRTAAVNLNPVNSSRLADDRFDRLLAAISYTLSPDSQQLGKLSSSRHIRLVRLSQEFMYAHMHESLLIRDHCKMFGVTYKTLERAFVQSVGVTPRQYLSIIRLSRARRLLLMERKGSTRIADVAMACGFDHLGRFSVNYRQWFGESPSQTLSS